MADASRLLAQSAAEWANLRHYEAHELLEDVAECFDADDPNFDIAIALVHVAAAFHKVIHDVGPQASPGKIRRALEVLDAAPTPWLELDLGAFRRQTRIILKRLERGETVRATEFPSLQLSPSEPGSS